MSHDIRLDVAAYKLTSNTTKDHRQHVDMKDIQNTEYMLSKELYEKMDDVHHDPDIGQYHVFMISF